MKKKKRRDQIVTHDPLGFANWTSGVGCWTSQQPFFKCLGGGNNNNNKIHNNNNKHVDFKMIIIIIIIKLYFFFRPFQKKKRQSRSKSKVPRHILLDVQCVLYFRCGSCPVARKSLTIDNEMLNACARAFLFYSDNFLKKKNGRKWAPLV